ncbi:hypothetical protein SRHO_G00337420 [Serrasalmus rhombeus]
MIFTVFCIREHKASLFISLKLISPAGPVNTREPGEQNKHLSMQVEHLCNVPLHLPALHTAGGKSRERPKLEQTEIQHFSFS